MTKLSEDKEQGTPVPRIPLEFNEAEFVLLATSLDTTIQTLVSKSKMFKGRDTVDVERDMNAIENYKALLYSLTEQFEMHTKQIDGGGIVQKHVTTGTRSVVVN